MVFVVSEGRKDWRGESRRMRAKLLSRHCTVAKYELELVEAVDDNKVQIQVSGIVIRWN